MMMIRRFFPTEVEGLLALEQAASPHPWRLGHYQSSLDAGHRFWGVFDHQEQLQGFAVLQLITPEAELLNIVIAEAAQGQGLGRQLLQQVCVELAAHGIQRLFLEVRASNLRAQTLYTRCQFKAIGQRKDYYPLATGREPAILMEALL